MVGRKVTTKVTVTLTYPCVIIGLTKAHINYTGGSVVLPLTTSHRDALLCVSHTQLLHCLVLVYSYRSLQKRPAIITFSETSVTFYGTLRMKNLTKSELVRGGFNFHPVDN